MCSGISVLYDSDADDYFHQMSSTSLTLLILLNTILSLKGKSSHAVGGASEDSVEDLVVGEETVLVL